MKKQIKFILELLVELTILNLSCRKNEHNGSPCRQPATGENDEERQKETAMKAGSKGRAQR